MSDDDGGSVSSWSSGDPTLPVAQGGVVTDVTVGIAAAPPFPGH